MIAGMKQKTSVAEQPKRHPGQFKPGQSGNPQGARIKSKRYMELYNGIAADYGGVETLTVLQRTALMRAVRLMLKEEKEKDTDLQLRLGNLSVRWLAAMQRNGGDPRSPAPKPPTPSLEDLLQRQPEGGTR